MAWLGDPRTAAKPCVQHKAEHQVRKHCPGGGICLLGPWNAHVDQCHVFGICRACDHQWIEPCREHRSASSEQATEAAA